MNAVQGFFLTLRQRVPFLQRTASQFFFPLTHLVRPLADPGVDVVGEPRGAGEPVGVTVAAVVEGGAVVRVLEGAVQAGAVGRGDGGLDLGEKVVFY